MATQRKRAYAMSRRHRAMLMAFGAVGVILLVWADRGGLITQRRTRPGANDQISARDRARYHGKRFPVTRVIDGDTLCLKTPDGESPVTKVRLLGIDAPEAASPDASAMFYWRQAADRAGALAMGINVTVYLDETGPSRGRYGRLLAYLEMPDGRFLNERLVSEGYAYADRRFPHSYYQKYKHLESSARSLGQGLWRDVSRGQLPPWLQRMEPDLLQP